MWSYYLTNQNSFRRKNVLKIKATLVPGYCTTGSLPYFEDFTIRPSDKNITSTRKTGIPEKKIEERN